MSDLVTWLRAQLDEDERQARDWPDEMDVRWYKVPAFTPARVLAEVEAKRRILEEHVVIEYTPGEPFCQMCHADRGYNPQGFPMPCSTVRLLSLPYADRPGYLEEWRP